jgi:tRNA-2-methylthio-N6-dimethylallyladenosine synthase
VEGISDEPGELRGRTPENRLVHLAADEGRAPVGALVAVRITRAGQSSLSGELA